MKSALINRYFELRESRSWAMLAGGTGLETSLAKLHMMRIDAILYERYGYDVSLTRKN